MRNHYLVSVRWDHSFNRALCLYFLDYEEWIQARALMRAVNEFVEAELDSVADALVDKIVRSTFNDLHSLDPGAEINGTYYVHVDVQSDKTFDIETGGRD